MHPSRTPIIGGNWKTNPQRRQDAVQLAADVRNRLGSHRGAEVVLFPPHPFLESVARSRARTSQSVARTCTSSRKARSPVRFRARCWPRSAVPGR
jgi:triosephosphate isomerase